MMWPIRAARVRPRLFGVVSTGSGTTVTLGTGADCIRSAVNADTSEQTLTFRRSFGSRPSHFGTAVTTDIGTRPRIWQAVASTAETCTFQSDNNGSHDAGTIHSLIGGIDSQDVNLLPPRGNAVLCDWDNPFILFGKIASGAITIGARQFAVTSGGTGIYVVTFKNVELGSAPVIAAQTISATANFHVRVASVSTTGFTLTCNNAAGAGAECDVYFAALCTHSVDPLSCQGSKLVSPWRRARLVWGAINGDDGSQGITSEFTSVRNGTGDYTLTWKTDYKPAREPLVFAQAYGSMANLEVDAAATTTGVTIKAYDAAGSAADTTFFVFIVMSDDATEY